jgi:hypothetical protein
MDCPYTVSIANVESPVIVTSCDGQTHEIVTGVHVSSHSSLPHNHPPLIDLIPGAPQLKYSATDEDSFWDDALHLYEAGINQGAVWVALTMRSPTYKSIINKQGLTASKVNSRVRHMSSQQSAERHSNPELKNDTAKFIETLGEMERGKEIVLLDVQLDPVANSPSIVMWCTAWQFERMRGLYRTNVFDDTHQTNRYNMFVGFFVTEDCFGKTIRLAQVFFKNQDNASFEFIFRCYKRLTDRCQVLALEAASPYASIRGKLVFMTDGCERIAYALQVVYGDRMLHLLCVWHLLSMNAKKHLYRYA